MRRTLLYFCCLLGLTGRAQPPGYAWPIDSPHVVTGNYGELRPNHFHAGIDFSTGGKVNRQVYTVKQGYVSRIRVSATGYGKSVYITHPGGLVTVYAHLNAFSVRIDRVVRAKQMNEKSYEVELYLTPDLLPVARQEIIGWSGNSGGSTGPHLHFEVRDEKTETPLNPLHHYYRITDTVRPVIRSVAIFDLSDTTSPQFMSAYQPTKKNNPQELPDIVVDRSIVGLSFSGFDRVSPKGSVNNIYHVRLLLDGGLIYSHALQAIDFADNRFVNEFSATVNRLQYQKCFAPTLYPPKLYRALYNKGRILLTDTLWHEVRFEFTDESGNPEQLLFRIKTTKFNYYTHRVKKTDLTVKCDEDFRGTSRGISLVVPRGSFYYTAGIGIQNDLSTAGMFSINPPELNLRNAITLGFQIPPAYKNKKNKLVLKSGTIALVGTIRNDSIYFAVKNLGTFRLDADIAGPQVKTLLNPKKIKKTMKWTAFSFVIKDALSGIGRYDVYVNGNWALAEYDAKSDLLTYFFDDLTPPGDLKFKVLAVDRVGNASTFVFTLKR